MTCLDKEMAAAYISGYVGGEQSERCAIHINECPGCRALIEQISEMIDSTRRDLLLLDSPVAEATIPPIEIIRSRSGASNRRQSRWLGLMPERLRPARALVIIVAFVATICGLLYFSGRRQVSAEEILRRSELATVNARTLPNRIIRRAWKETIKNGLGPLPDGEYRVERWWDNINRRFAYVRYDHSGALREGNWWLEDGTSYNFGAYPDGPPKVIVGPSDREIIGQIERLPEQAREAVRAYYQRSKRPFYQSAAEIVARTERDISDWLAGRASNATAQAVTLSDGRGAYWVNLQSDAISPEAIVRHWETSLLILDRTFNIIESRSSGYRADGLVYQIDKVLLDEQVFHPGDPEPRVFSPGPFPPYAVFHYVSAQERVELMRRHAVLPSLEEKKR